MDFQFNHKHYQNLYLKKQKRRFFLRGLTFALLFFITYFLYFVLYGNRGYFSLQALEKQIAVENTQLLILKKEEAEYARRVDLLGGEKGVDLDLLEERSRLILNYKAKGDAVIILPE